ncbi:hypothetical protein OIU34_02645 [Pararhizobium sp. BT-229]|uniref:hypothetical protein n=1 Tax=Pararhizobium sp. BT-229 TaxID=2986923 RepID=UPI0021F7496C|nr:hypothetical protein [Pararhizobium sp. BT-229]MCV9960787.1 hypothetical protein [Pararhizobium sp. BT-229]
MTNPPVTPSEWLLFLARLAEKHPVATITSAGDGLQLAFITFLVEAGMSNADPQDLEADLLTLLPRFSNALAGARHAGTPCLTCARKFASMAATEIVSDMLTMAERSKTGGLH